MPSLHQACEQTRHFLATAAIELTPDEQQQIEIATFGLPDYPLSGLQLLTYVNTPRYCAKELVLFPRQTCPEHRHPPFNGTRANRRPFAAAGGGLPVCRRRQPDPEQWRVSAAGGRRAVVQRHTLYPAAPRRAVHHCPEYPPLVPGRRLRCGGVGVLVREP